MVDNQGGGENKTDFQDNTRPLSLWTFGTVADKILRASDRPVLLVKHPARLTTRDGIYDGKGGT